MKVLRQNSCTITRQLLHVRLDGSLPVEQAEKLESHLAACPACARHAEHLGRAVALLRSARTVPVPTDLPRRIRAAVSGADAQSVRGEATGGRAASGTVGTVLSPVFARLATAGAVVALALAIVMALRVQPMPVSRSNRLPATRPVPTEGAGPDTLASTSAHEVVVPSPIRVALAPAKVSVPAARPVRRGVPREGATAHVELVVRRPQAAGVIAGSRVQVADASGEVPPTELYVANQRLSMAPTAKYATGEGAFADQVVGGMVADAMLNSYLDGAPPGIVVAPVTDRGVFSSP